MSGLKIKDAPLLQTLDGSEKIPTGGKGNYSVTVDVISEFVKDNKNLATLDYINSEITSVNEDVNTKADKATTYTKTETDNLLTLKADKDSTYTKTEVDSEFYGIYQNGAALPYDATMEYAEGAVVVKDGELQKKQGASWVSVGVKTDSELNTWSGLTQEEKNRERVSVKDLGAVGDGVTNDTSAFLAAIDAPYDVYVPAGEYVVDAGINLSRLEADNYAIIHQGGQRYSLRNPVSDGTHVLKHRLLHSTDMGYNTGSTWFSGSQRAAQAIAICDTPDGTRMYVMQAGTSNSKYSRIAEFVYDENGGEPTLIGFTDELPIGHQSLNAVYENGYVWLYTQLNSQQDPTVTTNKGKGYMKIRYRGTSTSESDITNYQLFGDLNTDHPLSMYHEITFCLSADAKYLVFFANDGEQFESEEDVSVLPDSGHALVIFERATVEAASNPLDVEPIYTKGIIDRPHYNNGWNLQGMACDSKYIYVQRGYYQPFSTPLIQVFDMYGNAVKEIFIDGSRGLWTPEQLYNGSESPASFEPEGMTIWGDKLIVLMMDWWREADVVSYRGKNYYAIQNNTGKAPASTDNWARTWRPATVGEWNSSTTYNSGAATRRWKRIVAIELEDADKLTQYPLNVGTAAKVSQASVFTGNNGVDIAYNYDSHFQIAGYSYNTERHYRCLYLSPADSTDGNTIRLYADRGDSTPDTYGTFSHLNSGSNIRTQIRANKNASEGAGINLYARQSEVAAGKVIMVTSHPTTGAAYEWHFQSESPAFRPNTADQADVGTPVAYRLNRTFSRFFGFGSAVGIQSGTGSPEGAVSAAIGSMYLRTDGSAGSTLYVKESGTGNTGWRAI